MHFAYTSIISGKKLDEVENNIEKSMAYKKIKKSFSDKMLFVKDEEHCSRDSFNIDMQDPSGTLFVDILMNRDKKHRKLDKLIEYAPFHSKWIIVIHNLHVLGTIEQIKDYYHKFEEKEIYVLCFDPTRLSGLSEYSTCGFNFDKREPLNEYFRAYELINQLPLNTKLKNNRGVLPSLNSAFIESYWQYETFQIPEDIAIATAGISRSPFHRKCALYEQSALYYPKIFEYNEHISLEQLPKRFSIFPVKFDELEQIIDAQWSLSLPYTRKSSAIIDTLMDDASIKLQIPSIHPINYRRLKLRREVGRKGVAASYCYNTDILEKFEKYSSNPQNNLTKFWDKYKNNEL